MAIYFDNKHTYKLAIEEENCAKKNHNDSTKLSLPKEIKFSGADFYEAIMLTGMLPSEARNPARKSELGWRSHMISWILDSRRDFLCINKQSLQFLESSEIRNFDYWLGMYFTTLVARKIQTYSLKHHYDYFIHYSSFKKSSLCTSIKNDTRLTPDIIATNNRNTEFGVFEAKGRRGSKSDDNTMEHAWEQLHSVKKINGNSKINRVVSYSLLDEALITVRIKDPISTKNQNDASKEDEGNLIFDLYPALIWQYMPIVELMHELNCRNGECECSLVPGMKGIYISNDFYQAVLQVSKTLIEETKQETRQKIINESVEQVKNLFENEKYLNFGIIWK